MQHRRRLQIFQAAKRAAFNQQHQADLKEHFQEENDKLFSIIYHAKSLQQM